MNENKKVLSNDDHVLLTALVVALSFKEKLRNSIWRNAAPQALG
jgi:hypothetical protein